VKTAVKVVFAGGGTGGHIYPALAVADALRDRMAGFRPLFIGTRTGLEATVVPGAAYEMRYIHARGFRGRGAVRKILTLIGIAVGVVQSFVILATFKPRLVFGTGGYASAAVVIAASMLRRTIVLQEQNSIPGLTNRMLASRAVRIYLGFERAAGHLAGHPGLVVTGNPLRRAVTDGVDGNPREAYGFAGDEPVLLVFGGSQGSRSLNRAAVEFFLERTRVRGIMQTGSHDYEWVKDRLRDAGDRIFIAPYIANIHVAYRAADLALSRAGALSVSELAAAGLPAILVPYPYAADDHQRFNARVLTEAGGAVVIADDELSGETLAATFDRLGGDPGRLAEMRRALGRVARADATERIARDICTLLGVPDGGGSGARAGEGVS
jgi:UDP-N-acetylglucosamine--N-acetylmuramyl-(pentapeptide) pyrophosphoryl-undecaprenol N-acetylglucosamine transferase